MKETVHEAQSYLDSTWEQVLPLLACPVCRDALSPERAALRCDGCGTGFPIRGGVPVLARFGSAEQWSRERPRMTSEDYQLCYQNVTDAADYNVMYSSRWAKRWNTRREAALLESLLGSQPLSRTLLELPCGGGRLSHQLARYSDLHIAADIALGQVQFALKHGYTGRPQVWMTASAFHIPLEDNSVDGVVCVRLNHHLPNPAERDRLTSELLRVARRFVVMTFFDYHSLKNLLRRLRAPFNGKAPKHTMTVQRVRELARAGGAELVACPALSALNSGHRYALMVKRPR